MKVACIKKSDWESDYIIAPLKTAMADRIIELCPRLTKEGFKICKLDESIYSNIYQKTLSAYYLRNATKAEHARHDAVSNTNSVKPEICWMQDDYLNRFHKDPDFVRLHEEFAGIALAPSHWYGPRVYHKGDLLREHIDHPTSHLIGSSINICSEGGNDWPLVFRFKDHYTKVILEPGEIIFFEAISLPHSRPYRYTGDRYFGIFFHYFAKDPSALFTKEYLDLAEEYEKIM